jgi:hypothetical protein
MIRDWKIIPKAFCFLCLIILLAEFNWLGNYYELMERKQNTRFCSSFPTVKSCTKLKGCKGQKWREQAQGWYFNDTPLGINLAFLELFCFSFLLNHLYLAPIVCVVSDI